MTFLAPFVEAHPWAVLALLAATAGIAGAVCAAGWIANGREWRELTKWQRRSGL